MTALSDEVRALLDRPNFAHLATLMADGAPHVDPVRDPAVPAHPGCAELTAGRIDCR